MTKTKIEWSEEVWNPVRNAPGLFIDANGNIKGRSGSILSPQVSRSGHLYVMVRLDGRKSRAQKFWIHRAVLAAFVGPCPDGHEACHRDGNPANNAVDNLYWGTLFENAADKQRHGTQPRGESAGTAKLTEVQVRELRERKGTASLRALGREFGVSHTAIRRAINRTKWRHVQ